MARISFSARLCVCRRLANHLVSLKTAMSGMSECSNPGPSSQGLYVSCRMLQHLGLYGTRLHCWKTSCHQRSLRLSRTTLLPRLTQPKSLPRSLATWKQSIESAPAALKTAPEDAQSTDATITTSHIINTVRALTRRRTCGPTKSGASSGRTTANYASSRSVG